MEYDDARVLITDMKIETIKDMIPILEQVSRLQKPLIIIAEDVTGALSQAVASHGRTNRKPCSEQLCLHNFASARLRTDAPALVCRRGAGYPRGEQAAGSSECSCHQGAWIWRAEKIAAAGYCYRHRRRVCGEGSGHEGGDHRRGEPGHSPEGVRNHHMEPLISMRDALLTPSPGMSGSSGVCCFHASPLTED